MTEFVPLHGFGGFGGSSLNFKIVGGTTAPTNPNENTIWVNTDQEINGWYLTDLPPESAVEGAVWIITGTSSQVAFNALKKNSIQVYPISAKQYVNSTWVDKTAKTYQGSKWVDWITYLYRNGDECSTITGGWVAQPKTDTKRTVTKKADSIFISSTNGGGVIYAATANMIDLTKVETITIKVVETSGYKRTLYILPSDTDWGNSPKAAASLTLSATGEQTLDVSSLEGSYYVAVCCYASGSESPYRASAAFSEVRM